MDKFYKAVISRTNTDWKNRNLDLSLSVEDDGEGYLSLSIHRGGKKEVYAQGMREEEMMDCIRDATEYAESKYCIDKVERLAELYLELTDAEKDKFLELTGNQ